jgi:hypothetical protein
VVVLKTVFAATHGTLAAIDEIIKIVGAVNLGGEKSSGAYADALAIKHKRICSPIANTATIEWRSLLQCHKDASGPTAALRPTLILLFAGGWGNPSPWALAWRSAQ